MTFQYQPPTPPRTHQQIYEAALKGHPPHRLSLSRDGERRTKHHVVTGPLRGRALSLWTAPTLRIRMFDKEQGVVRRGRYEMVGNRLTWREFK